MRRKMARIILATIILAGVMALLLASCGGSLTINCLELSGEEAERYAIDGREDIPAPSEQRYYSCETENPQSYQFYFWRLEDGEWLRSKMGDGAMQEGENILTVYMKGDQDGFGAGVNVTGNGGQNTHWDTGIEPMEVTYLEERAAISSSDRLVLAVGGENATDLTPEGMQGNFDLDDLKERGSGVYVLTVEF